MFKVGIVPKSDRNWEAKNDRQGLYKKNALL